jgi:AAA+ superfamily predicted ATPase
MSYNYRIIFLSFSIFSSSLAVENPQQNNIPNPPIKITSLDVSDIPEIIRNILNNQQHHHHHEHHHHHYPQQQQSAPTIAQSLVFSEIDIEELKLVFKTSPKEAQFIIKYLQNPTLFQLSQDYRSATFVGEPGTGKTTTAKAIAYEMSKQGWECKFLSSPSLLGEHRNQTSIRLQKELEAIETSKKPTLLIIDELNRLLENSNSKHHDTDTIATALWTFLDKQRDNKDFFFIGTMNRANKLAKAYKSRILLDYIEFPLVSDPKFKNEFIRRELTTKSTTLDAEITNEFLDKELEKIGICAARDLRNISNYIHKTSQMAKTTTVTDKMVINKVAITNAMDRYIQAKIKLDYDIEEETDEERQNRHHEENLEMQQSLFIQQQMIQLTTNENQVSRQFPLSPWGINYLSPEGKKKIDLLISDKQKELLEEMMKETNAKRADEEKAAAEKAKNSRWNYPWGNK